jgi:predicted DNA-binding transcriptional regulator AlpA
VTLRRELQAVLDSIAQLPAENLPELLGELEVCRARATMRLHTPAPSTQQHDELLDVAAAAERLGMSRDFVYRHADEFSFTRRIGRKLLFSSLGIDKCIQQKKSR